MCDTCQELKSPHGKSLESLSEILEVLPILEMLEASRIPPDLRGRITFFSANDFWFYIAVMDGVTCQKCKPNNGDIFTGDELRTEFQYLEIVDEDTIYVKLHPNCRCILHRVNWGF